MTTFAKVFTFTVKAAVLMIWLLLAYVVIDWAGQQIEFARALGSF